MEVGLKITAIRPMTKKEVDGEAWDSRHPIVAIEFDNGDVIYASRDEEGNGPGAIFGYNKKTKTRFGLVL